MSQLKQMLMEDVGYTAWANQELLGACADLTHEQLNRDLGTSHGSLLSTFRHIYYSEREWLRRLLANALPPLVEIGDQRLFGDSGTEPTLEELAKRWPDVWRGLHEWIEESGDEVLSGEMNTQLPSGGEFCMTRAKIVTHAVNHSTLHRGQIVSMLRELGAKPPNTDMFSYYMVR
jgi:uncharacterized damage-inducible protein DinB